ncbi:hypothetical protein AOQ84DRAFT_376380, partial [Glonium stellatum]
MVTNTNQASRPPQPPRPNLPRPNPPPGTAPDDPTFTPQPTAVTGRGKDAKVDTTQDAGPVYTDPDATTSPPSAADTLGGATSAGVNCGLGHPGQGQTSVEVRHDGQHGWKRERLGLARVGAAAGVGGAAKGVDERDPR